MSSSGITESLNIFISRFRCWGELATNHGATVNQPLSLPVKLINCLFPTVLFPTWGNTTAEEHRSSSKAREGLEMQSDNMCRLRLLGQWEAARGKDLVLS